MAILDSGNRREFDTGAVRDIAEGKGRCDLLPLDIVADLYDNPDTIGILAHINEYVRRGDTTPILYAIHWFIETLDLDLETVLLEVAKHYEDGANKYSERNWEKGIPLHCYIDSGVRHYLKYLRGDKDERHDRAFLWNLLCALWTHKHRPECIDLPFNEGENDEKIETAL